MTDLSASTKRVKLDVELPSQIWPTVTADDWRREILHFQRDIEAKAANGAAFLAEMSLPTLPDDVSVTGVMAQRFKSFCSEKWSDDAVLAIYDYVRSKDGVGACHAWLHARLKGLTLGGGGDCAWDESCTEACVWLVLRYVTATPALIEQGERIVRALESDAAWVATADSAEQKRRHKANVATARWDHLMRDFFATLDSDPYWAAHPIYKK